MQINTRSGRLPRIKLMKRERIVLEQAIELLEQIGSVTDGELQECSQQGAMSVGSVLEQLEILAAKSPSPDPAEGQKELPFDQQAAGSTEAAEPVGAAFWYRSHGTDACSVIHKSPGLMSRGP